MKWIQQGIPILLVLVASAAFADTTSVTVDCNSGQSLNRTLSKLDKHTPVTVSVSGTCAEYVQVIGFENLTLKGLAGATLVQPSTAAGTLFNSLLLIESSHSVSVDGLNVQADVATSAAIGIGHGSSDIRLRRMNVTGGVEGILIFENSQASIAYVNAQDPGYTTLGVYDSSDVHVEHCVFKDSSGDLWHVGIDVGASHVTIYGTTITNMQVSINQYASSVVDVEVFTTYFSTDGPTDVVLENPTGTNYNGVQVVAGGSLNVTTSRLVIRRPGQTWGGTTGGVLLSGNASMNATGTNVLITGSQGQGVVALNNSHAILGGATITGGSHGGLVATNLSSIDVTSASTLTVVRGNSVDLFCDSNSTITGSVNLSGVPLAQCANLLSGETVALP